MPCGHGTYFRNNEELQATEFLRSQGLTENQISGVRAWERSQIGAQVSIWSGASLVWGGYSVFCSPHLVHRMLVFRKGTLLKFLRTALPVIHQIRPCSPQFQ